MIQEIISKGYRIYIAYGRYMSFTEMHELCPSAIYVGCGVIDHYRLTYQGEADNGAENIMPCHSNRLYVAVWGIALEDEMKLDTAYNYRFAYTKCRCDILYNSCMCPAYTYVLNSQLPLSSPSRETKEIMREGYSDNNIPVKDWDPRFF